MGSILKIVLLLTVLALSLLIAVSLFFYLTRTPSNDREWQVGHQVLPKVEISGDDVVIDNLRDFNWANDDNPVVYRSAAFKMSEIKSVEVGVSHFSEHEGIAHVFLVFVIDNQDDIALSVEARRTIGEKYTIKGGLTFSFDLAYFLTSKKDVLSIRDLRDERVYLFKTITSADESQALFELVAQRANQLYETPEFYHVFFNNCTSSVVAEVEKLSDLKFPFYEKSFAPGFSGKVLFDMGLLKTEKNNFPDAKKEALVNFETLYPFVDEH